MSKRRHTADTITDDALDALYDNASRGWRRGDDWKARALAAEEAVGRALAWADELDKQARALNAEALHPVAAGLRLRIDYTPPKGK